jgi:hypothetical protein
MRPSNGSTGSKNRHPLKPIGNIPPAEPEERYYAMPDEDRMAV